MLSVPEPAGLALSTQWRSLRSVEPRTAKRCSPGPAGPVRRRKDQIIGVVRSLDASPDRDRRADETITEGLRVSKEPQTLRLKHKLAASQRRAFCMLLWRRVSLCCDVTYPHIANIFLGGNPNLCDAEGVFPVSISPLWSSLSLR